MRRLGDETDAKDPKRFADRRDTYVGQQVTIFDNRGTCQHSGFCTDRLSTVFRVDKDPFVAPSVGRMDEIIRAVRDCPSGALSYALDGIEARTDVDYHGTRAPSIEAFKDGPYRVTGAIALLDADDDLVVRNAGASNEHCNCREVSAFGISVQRWMLKKRSAQSRGGYVRSFEKRANPVGTCDDPTHPFAFSMIPLSGNGVLNRFLEAENEVLLAGFLTLVRIAASDLEHHCVTKRLESDVFITWPHLDNSRQTTKVKAWKYRHFSSAPWRH